MREGTINWIGGSQIRESWGRKSLCKKHRTIISTFMLSLATDEKG